MVTSQAIIQAAKLPFTAAPDSPEAVTLISALPVPLLDAVTAAKDKPARTLAINDCGLWLAYHWQSIMPGIYDGKHPGHLPLAPGSGADYWPLPWRNELESGCLGHIVAANGETVAQVQTLSPAFEKDTAKRNHWRNIMAQRICDAVNPRGATTEKPTVPGHYWVRSPAFNENKWYLIPFTIQEGNRLDSAEGGLSINGWKEFFGPFNPPS